LAAVLKVILGSIFSATYAPIATMPPSNTTELTIANCQARLSPPKPLPMFSAGGKKWPISTFFQHETSFFSPFGGNNTD
jgi:hypothetical protein